MAKLGPANDYFMVEIEQNQYGFTGGKKIEEGVETGRVVAISDKMAFFGFNTYMFDSSLMNGSLLTDIYDHYKSFVGKKVWWPALSERGAVIEADGKVYAMVKMSAISAVLDEDEPDNGGSDMWPEVKEGDK